MDLTVRFFRGRAGLQHSTQRFSQSDPLMRVRRERPGQHLSVHLWVNIQTEAHVKIMTTLETVMLSCSLLLFFGGGCCNLETHSSAHLSLMISKNT